MIRKKVSLCLTIYPLEMCKNEILSAHVHLSVKEIELIQSEMLAFKQKIFKVFGV